MATAIVKHAGARYVVITDVNEYRLALARKMGVTVALNVTTGNLADVQKQLGMKEGFDVGLEMSGNPSAFRSMLDNMAHGGKIAMLGIPSEQIAIDWNIVVFNMLTIHGIYGREMYETWYKMTVMLESGLDIRPVITHRFPIEQATTAYEVITGKKKEPFLGVHVFHGANGSEPGLSALGPIAEMAALSTKALAQVCLLNPGVKTL